MKSTYPITLPESPNGEIRITWWNGDGHHGFSIAGDLESASAKVYVEMIARATEKLRARIAEITNEQ